MYSRNHSLVLNQVLQKGSATWCPTEAPEKDTEEEEEAGEEDQEEEEDEEKGDEEKRVKVEPPCFPAASPPDPLAFERYLSFYKQTMDLLTANGIVSSQEVTLPIVSAAISHLWQNLSEARKASLLKVWAQMHSSLPGLAGACQESACAEGSVKDSGVESQGASCSLTSTPEEILLEDTFDVASFLDKTETPSTSSSSSAFAGCNPENPEEKFQLYMQIINYFKGLPSVNFQVKQVGQSREWRPSLTSLRALQGSPSGPHPAHQGSPGRRCPFMLLQGWSTSARCILWNRRRWGETEGRDRWTASRAA
ncbi:stimulated by retinoic acid gene 8 protein isoform X1 [Manis pentadactyla]|uniref:stimulated by retinoic acid gene 8 protein isoform X1 n=1 Tax=Manis pentadactyla TaxID=143292 RepID=UPI00255C4DDF|nr:stimulated by retinoic acid gene 8 protein isoform X1 [Manis pentadactyla]